MGLENAVTVVETAWGFCAVSAQEAGLWTSSLPEGTPEAALRAARITGVPRAGCQPTACPPNDAPAHSAVLQAAAAFLQAYFLGEPSAPQVPLALEDLPPFTRKVLEACCRIGPGEIATYGQLARAAGVPEAARAVGQAMAHNRLPLFVPCHRVVGSGGRLTGFGGGLDLKARLLTLEGLKVKSQGAGNWRVVS